MGIGKRYIIRNELIFEEKGVESLSLPVLYFESLEGGRDPFGLNTTNIKTTASNFKMPLDVCFSLGKRLSVGIGQVRSLECGFSFPFSFWSVEKKKNFPPPPLLLHFLLKVSEKRKKCDGIEVPEKKGTFSSCGMYARMPQKGKFAFQITLQTRAGFLWSIYA